MSIKNVVLIGAGGNLGPTILEGLVPQFTVTVLTRASSKSTFPSKVKVAKIADDYPYDELVTIFKGQDAVVSTVAGMAVKKQKSFIDAAAEAGVKRFIPGEFGSDTQNPENAKGISLFQGKKDVIDYLRSKESTGLTWTGIANGVFFDWGIHFGFLKFDVKNKKATILDTGDERWPATNLKSIGNAVAKVLLKFEETKNKFIFMQDFRVSQNQILAALEKETGSKFEVTKLDRNTLTAESEAMLASDKFVKGLMGLVFAHAICETKFEDKPTFANGILDLQEADFDESIKKVVADTK